MLSFFASDMPNIEHRLSITVAFQMIEHEMNFYSLKPIVELIAKNLTQTNKYHAMSIILENGTPNYF